MKNLPKVPVRLSRLVLRPVLRLATAVAAVLCCVPAEAAGVAGAAIEAMPTVSATAAGTATAPPTTPAPAAAATPLRAGLVVQDAVALRSAARDSAPVRSLLWRGESVEIRSGRGDHFQVWDYRRERGGYLRQSQVLVLPEGPGAAAELLAQLRLAQRQPGAEALALGLAAAYVQAASAVELLGPGGAEALDAMGVSAERLADQASAAPAMASVLSTTAPASKAEPAQLVAQLDVAARYGLRFASLEAENGRLQLCYDGEAFRRVLAIRATPEQRARAALALTRPDCANSRASLRDVEARDAWRLGVLDQLDLTGMAVFWKNRVLMRRASVAASLAFAQARRGQPGPLATQALSDFASIAPAELTDDDVCDYNDAAMRVNAARWLGLANASPNLPGLTLTALPGVDGQTCVQLRDTRQPNAAGAERCGHGLVALASASVNREGNALALAVQPLDGWRELWVFVKSDGAWRIEVLPPAAAQPGLGFAEFAGWVPGGMQMLVAREARAEGRYKRSFEVLALAGLTTERQSADPRALGPFQRWPDAAWQRASLSLR